METCFDRIYTYPLQVNCGGTITYSFYQFQSFTGVPNTLVAEIGIFGQHVHWTLCYKQ